MVRHGLNEKIREEIGDEVRVADREIEVARHDVDAARRHCPAAVEPPLERGSFGALGKRLEGFLPRDRSQSRALEHHRFQVRREPVMDPRHVGGRAEQSTEGVDAGPAPTHVHDALLAQRVGRHDDEVCDIPVDAQR